MKRHSLLLALAALLTATGGAVVAAPQPPSSLEALTTLIRSNLTGITEAEIQQAALRGVLDHFQGRVVLGELKSGPASGALVTRTARYDEAYGLVRLGRVEAGAAARVRAAINGLSSNAPLKGLVLDLRYAAGGDYRAAAQVADLFVARAQPLLDWGAGRASAKTKKNAFTLPLVVLANAQTRGAAEALAAVLRRAAGALVIGSPTAGAAALFQQFTLPDGQVVHIASGQLKVGGEPLPPGGVRPDITVEVNARDERAWFADPFKTVPVQVASTTAPPEPRRRINEAELVRRMREGIPADDPAEPVDASTGPPKPVLRDPALARALHVLKAVTILQPRPE
jgi:hypothetical protein